jgi:alpha-glucosidase
MYVVFESPVQMLADTPTNYAREQDCLTFLSKVPSVWDETRVLDAKVADYVVVARRRGDTWYVGAMTDWTPRDLQIDLAFLSEGDYEMTLYQDGMNADRNGSDYKLVKRAATRSDKLRVHLAAGGGWAAVLSRRP